LFVYLFSSCVVYTSNYSKYFITRNVTEIKEDNFISSRPQHWQLGMAFPDGHNGRGHTQSDRAMFVATHAGIPYSHPLISVGSPLGRPSSPKPPLVPPRGSHCPRRTTSSARPRRRQVVNCAPPTSMLPPRSSVCMRVMGRQAQITTAANFQWW
jgi:hypothetical protein